MSLEELREYNRKIGSRSRPRSPPPNRFGGAAKPRSGRRAKRGVVSQPAAPRATAMPARDRLIDEVLRRISASMTLTGALMGDPMPGRSALDKRGF
jgi:hypothetical protein